MPASVESDFSTPCMMCDGRPVRMEVVPPGPRPNGGFNAFGGRFRRPCSVCKGTGRLHRDHARAAETEVRDVR